MVLDFADEIGTEPCIHPQISIALGMGVDASEQTGISVFGTNEEKILSIQFIHNEYTDVQIVYDTGIIQTENYEDCLYILKRYLHNR